MNPLDTFHASSSTFTEGNLKVSEAGGNAKYTQVGNFGMSSGKWYFEFCGVNSDNTWMLGIGDVTKGLDRGYTGSAGDGLFVYVDGDKYAPTSASSYGVSWTHGDVMGVAVDMDNNAMYFAKNNTWMDSGVPTSGSTKTGAAYTTELVGKTWVAAMGRGSTNNTITATFNFGQDSSFAGAKTAQGNQDGNDKGDFYYTPPSGFLALCTDNLDSPSIADPTAHFNTAIWSGNDTYPRTIDVGFDPGLVWGKSRTDSGTDHYLLDSVRTFANGKALSSNATNAEGVKAANVNINGTTSTGFTMAATSGYDTQNKSGQTYVAWNWKAGGTASSNGDGTITSSVSANTTAGFSIVSYTGTGANATVGHGLSQTPELIIVKSRDSAEAWNVYAEPVSADPATDYLILNTTAAVADDDRFWNDTAPTSSVFTVGSYDGTNKSGDDFIAYCWHSVPGFSKIAKFDGTSLADGPFLQTGFAPAMVMIKMIEPHNYEWLIFDNQRPGYNVVSKKLVPNATDAEGTGTYVDFLSNGIKLRDNSYNNNHSSSSYLFIAFAESPQKFSNAR